MSKKLDTYGRSGDNRRFTVALMVMVVVGIAFILAHLALMPPAGLAACAVTVCAVMLTGLLLFFPDRAVALVAETAGSGRTVAPLPVYKPPRP